ncbi:glycosyltransferase family 4 protein [Thalassotalea sp. G2M2-11]|uniref:glycosyltransferase family 4 protein n=1 Tax=Thalassotalea sp. G2M2-11 TaxID=2787627 RepID=UPI0019D0B58E|nr:glycosyltransferase family 4 protein [Thalassotalea sp. G2M2-11]
MINNNNVSKVLHVVSSLEVGGAERFVIDLCQVQREKGEKVAILTFGSQQDPLVSECKKNDIEVFFVSGSRTKKWQMALKVINKFTIIHFHSPYPLKFLLPCLPIYFFKKVIYTRHGADPLSGFMWGIVHKIANYFVDHVTFVSQEGADVFENSHGWLRKTKHVIDNGVNFSKITIHRETSDCLRLGSVGRMVPLKNQISLLKAVSYLPSEYKKKVLIHFYGDGPCLAELQQFVDENDLSEQVVFHGMVSDRSTIYNSFDVLVVTSETEGLSLAIIEAMAYSCAIIATHVGGNPKLVSHQKNGYLFEYDDDKALSGYIKTLQNNVALNEQFAQESREKVAQQFSLDECAKKYQQLYLTS